MTSLKISIILQQYWPFSLLRTDDLTVSNRLVRQLSIPEQTKQFVFAIPDPKTGSTVYILAIQNLSEQSVSDAENLIKVIQPEAVIAQVDPSALPEIQSEETLDDVANSVPTSSLGVIRRCFKDKFNRIRYEKLAGSLVLREIFGTGFHGHLLASKQAAEEVDAHFLLLESPYENAYMVSPHVDSEADGSRKSLLQSKHLLSRNVISTSSNRVCFSDPIQYQMLKFVTQSLSMLVSGPNSSSTTLKHDAEDCHQSFDFQAPPFAQPVYELLADLHAMFSGLPAISNALVYARKMLVDVNEGVPVDARILSEVHNFRVAIEGLRIALNSAARYPIYKPKNEHSLEFDLLPPEEKCLVLFAQALRRQTKNFKSVVAIVDAGSLAALRKHWDTPVPSEVAHLANEAFIRYYNDYDNGNVEVRQVIGKKRLLADKPVVVVGTGATAVLGATSFSKALPASTFMKLVSYKIPAALKFSFAHLQRSAAVGLGKILGSSNVITPGVASKVSSIKVTASAEKIRRVTHGVIASVERTSLYAMRTAFYEIMRRRHVRPVRFAPWATFMGSMATCAGLLVYGDGIECAAESIPSASVIASWGRGLQSLHQASQEVGQANRTKIQEALQSLMYNLKKMKVQ